MVADDLLGIQFEDKWTPPGYKPPTNETIAKVCNLASVTLDCFNTLYGTLGYKQIATLFNTIRFNNCLNQSPVRTDIFGFLERYNLPAAPEAFTFQSIEIAGGPAAQYTKLTPEQAAADDFTMEAVLDSETILGMTFPIPVTSFSTGGSPPFISDLNEPADNNEPYLTWLHTYLGYIAFPKSLVVPTETTSSPCPSLTLSVSVKSSHK